MIKIPSYLIHVFLFLFIFVCVGCANKSENNRQSKKYSDRAHAVSVKSQDGHYIVSLFSNEYPIPLAKIHQWIVHVETTNGNPVESANVFVFGGMPLHQHGFPTKPKVRGHVGNGDYLVEGIKFSMMGHWEMRFNIKENDKRDRVVFDINL